MQRTEGNSLGKHGRKRRALRREKRNTNRGLDVCVEVTLASFLPWHPMCVNESHIIPTLLEQTVWWAAPFPLNGRKQNNRTDPRNTPFCQAYSVWKTRWESFFPLKPLPQTPIKSCEFCCVISRLVKQGEIIKATTFPHWALNRT